MTEPKKDLDTPQKIRAALFKWVIRTSYHRGKDEVQDIIDRIPSPDAGEPKRDEAGLREAATFVEALGPIIDLLDLDGFDGEAECLRDLRTALAAHPAPSEPEGEVRPCRWKSESTAYRGYSWCETCGSYSPCPYDSKPESELPATPPESPWRPLAEAPRDGTWILGLYYGRIIQTRWHEGRGWVESLDGLGHGLVDPEFWMPLPAPPETFND